VKVMNETDPAYASARTRVEAADKLLGHLKRPEAAEVTLNVNTPANSGLNELQNMLKELSTRQLMALKDGGDVRIVANLPVIEGTCTPVGEPK